MGLSSMSLRFIERFPSPGAGFQLLFDLNKGRGCRGYGKGCLSLLMIDSVDFNLGTCSLSTCDMALRLNQ